jgi:hypothetical protein
MGCGCGEYMLELTKIELLLWDVTNIETAWETILKQAKLVCKVEEWVGLFDEQDEKAFIFQAFDKFCPK